MTAQANYIFEILTAADVGISDFARLTNISRQTLHHWKVGKFGPDKMRWTLAYNTAKRIETATEEGRLPLRGRMPAAEKAAVLKRIVLRT